MSHNTWTPNWESDADRFAPILANISCAGAIHYWLHSRVFATNNEIHVSVSFLAETLHKDRRTIQRAIDQLVAAGLIIHKSRSGNGGGSTFSLVGISDVAFTPRPSKKEGVANATSNAANTPSSKMSISPRKTRQNRRTTNSEELPTYNPLEKGPYDV